jgi:hypothetical protein
VGTLVSSTVYIYNVTNSFSYFTQFSAFSTLLTGVYEIDFSPNDNTIVICGGTSSISTWMFDTNINDFTLNWVTKLSTNTSAILWSCKFSDDGSTIGVGCIGCTSNSLFILESIANPTNPAGYGNSSGPYDIDFKKNDNNTLISSFYNFSNLYEVNVIANTILIGNTNGSPSNSIYAVSCSKDGSYVAIGLGSNTSTAAIRF